MAWLIVPLVLIVIGGVAVGVVRTRVRSLSQQLFQTDSLTEGYAQVKEELSQKPKSVSGMTTVYLPQIARDFPEFHLDEFKNRAENMLQSAFAAITTGDVAHLQNASPQLTQRITLQIENNRSHGIVETYRNVTLYQTEIARYVKQGGTCTITLQSAVGHDYTAMQGGKLVAGDGQYREQCKYNIHLVYIQDAGKLALDANAHGTTCPNCGAPITNLGAKSCDYCGGAVEAINVKVWQIDSYEKNKV